MLLILTVVVVALGLGFALGGRLSGFEGFRLRWWALGPVGLAMQLLPVPFEGEAGDVARVALLIGSYVALFAFAAVNLRAPGVPLILLGLAMNFLVIAVNTGMPVSRDALVATDQEEAIAALDEVGIAKHHLASDDDVLLFLADVIPIGGPFDQVVSAGDLAIYAGVVWLVVGIMRRPTPETEPARPPGRSGPRRGRHRRARRPRTPMPSGTEP